MLNWTQLLNQKRRKDKLKSGDAATTANGRFEIERDYDRILFRHQLDDWQIKLKFFLWTKMIV